MANKIECHVGDLFELLPNYNASVVIAHIVNDLGKWGSGFVVPLGMRFPKARLDYLNWANPITLPTGNEVPFRLGQCQLVDVTENQERPVIVANMLAQKGIKSPTNISPIRYESLASCLRVLADFCSFQRTVGLPVEIHSPAFGTERAGGNPLVIKALIEEILLPSVDGLCIYSLRESHPFD